MNPTPVLGPLPPDRPSSRLQDGVHPESISWSLGPAQSQELEVPGQGPEPTESLSICPGLGRRGSGLFLSVLTHGDCCSKPTSIQTAFSSPAQLRLQEPGLCGHHGPGDGAGLPHDVTCWCPAPATSSQWWRVEGLISKPLVAVSWGGAFLLRGHPGSATICCFT